MTPNVAKALELAEPHLEKGEWVLIKPNEKPEIPLWMYVGTVHSNGFQECHHISYMIKDGVAVKHVGI